jgi:hypothetical protein
MEETPDSPPYPLLSEVWRLLQPPPREWIFPPPRTPVYFTWQSAVASVISEPKSIGEIADSLLGAWFFEGRSFHQITPSTAPFYLTEGALADVPCFAFAGGKCSFHRPVSDFERFIFSSSTVPLRTLLHETLQRICEDSVDMATVVKTLKFETFRSDLGELRVVGVMPESRIAALVDSFSDFVKGPDATILRRSRTEELDEELQTILTFDPHFEGLTFWELCKALNYNGTFLECKGRVLHLIGHERVFWFNTRIGVRPNLSFRQQTPFRCPQDTPLLYELILEALSLLTHPISIDCLLDTLDGKSFITETGTTEKVSPHYQFQIRGFVDTFPAIFRMNDRYWLMPLESEVDFFGGLYLREAHYLANLFGGWGNRYLWLPRFAFLRFPRKTYAACFLGRIHSFRHFLVDYLGVSQADPASMPPFVHNRLHIFSTYQVLPFAPFAQCTRATQRFPDTQLRKLNQRKPAVPAAPGPLPLPVIPGAPRAAAQAQPSLLALLRRCATNPAAPRFSAFSIDAFVDALANTGLSSDSVSVALIAAELRVSRQFYESPPGSFTYLGFDILPPSYSFASLEDLIEFTLALMHVNTGLGGAAFEAGALNEALAGKRFSEGSGRVSAYRAPEDAAGRLHSRAQTHGGLFWVSGTLLYLLRLSINVL